MKILSTHQTHCILLTAILLILPDIALASSASLNLKWQPNTESDLSFYSVYCGTSSRVYGNPIPVGKATAYTVEGLEQGRKYYCALTATDTSGNESGFSSEVSTIIPNPVQQPSIMTKLIVDFNGDGQVDILWHQNASGDNVAWHMNGASQNGHSWLPKLNDVLWKLAGVGDFNQDGRVDILWRHSRSGQMVAWHMDGAEQIGHSWLPTLAGNLWEVGGIGDFDQDGAMDILWHHTGSGANFIWHMEGAKLIGTTILKTVPDTNWKIGGLGDFNQDGDLDIMWHQSKSGEGVVWFMNGTNQIGHSWLPKRNDKNWRDWEVTGVGDFNNDGSADILWRNYKNGENSIWLMNKTVKNATATLSTVSNASWESRL
jgi:hypothetical protein